MVHVHKLLLHGQVMVSYCQNRNTIFEFFRRFCALFDLIIIFLLAARLPAMGQVVHEQRRLDDYDGLVRVQHRMIVAAKLGQNSTHVQVSVRLRSRSLMPLLDF